MSVPLGQLALEARHLPGVRRVHVDVLGHLLCRLLPFLAGSDWGVNTGNVESEENEGDLIRVLNFNNILKSWF